MIKSATISLLALAVATPALSQTTATTTIATDDTAAGDNIVVTASRSGDAIPIDLVGSSVTVIDAQDLRDRQTRILSDVLRDVPGVAVSRLGAVGGQTQVRIRGAEGNHTLVFIDGIKASDPYDGEYDFATLLADESARVEVLRGQQSSLYGSDAIGGVISYTTLSGREAPGFTARAEGGSMGTYSGAGRAAGTLGETFDYALTSSYYHTDGYAVAPGGNRDLGSNSLGASGKVNWTPAPNFKVTAVGRYSYTKADTDDQAIAANSLIVRGYPTQIEVDTPGEYYTNKGYYGLLSAELGLFDGAWTNTASAQIADTTREGFGAFGGIGKTSGDKGRRYRGSLTSTVRFGNDRVKNRFTAAVDAEREEFRNTTPIDPTIDPASQSFDGRHTIDTIGIVAQYDVTINDRLALGASARIDDNQMFDDDATYRATASYLFPTGTRVHTAYGTGVKAPSAGDLFGYSDGKYIGNPNLRPELSKGWEAGVEQELLDKRVRIGATWFDNRFVHQIDNAFVVVNGNFLTTTFNNAVKTKQHGIEAYADAHFGDVRLDASYTWLHAPQTIDALANPAPANPANTQFPVPITTQAVRRAKNIASVNLTYAPKALPFTGTVTVRYNGKQGDYAFNPDFSRLIVDLKAYTLVNLAATYDITKSLQLFGRVENLLDKHYQEVFGYETPGRAGYGGVRVRF
jgi:vitamin B12 transporter